MVWTTAGTNRVCARCMELKDTVVGCTDESGVTLPPLHPRCRCTIMYREVKPTENFLGVEADTIGTHDVLFRKQVSLSAILEETHHIKQNRRGMNENCA
ncbi:MAG: hypothetical protein IJL12_08855 [Selenomonadaceae bacterium]|nr:hypothetical protein [Selenomonadaceae bacterium]MBQ6132431.1 hypothetical protein [Selenomonadaceae bacterium]